MSALPKVSKYTQPVRNPFAGLWSRLLSIFRPEKTEPEYDIPEEAMVRLLRDLQNPRPASERAVQSLREALKDTSL
ncbi:MAG: hypothetical protein Q3986_07570 [Akkermansia sp.]|nr:hypothetical protein [Akkermansia sp.]